MNNKQYLNIKEILSISVVLLFLILFLAVKLNFSVDISNAPDETGENLFIEQLSKNGKLAVDDLQILNIENKNVFAPRGTVVNNKGEILPLKAIISNYLYASSYIFNKNYIDVSRNLIIVNYIFILVFLLYCYKFLLSFNLDKNYLYLVIILLLIFISKLDNFITHYNLFFFVGFYYLKKWLDSQNKSIDWNLILSSLMLSMVILLRNELVILFVPLIFFFGYLILFKEYRITIITFFFVPFLALSTILISNNFFYGNYLTFGYSLDSKSREAFKSDNTSLIVKIGKYFLLYGFHPFVVIKNFYNYILLLFYFFLIPCFFNISIYKQNLKFSLVIFLIAFYILIFYGSNGTFFGNETVSIDSSYVRYFSPIYLILLVYSIPTYIKILREINKSSNILPILASLVFLILLVSSYKNNLQSFNNQRNYLYLLDSFRLIVPSKSIIFTKYWDKLFYKDYIVGTFSKKLDSDNDYYDTMIAFSIKYLRKRVYFIPTNMEEKSIFNKYISKSNKVRCKDINMLLACRLIVINKSQKNN